MNLVETIKQHRFAALKAGEKATATFLSFLHAEVQNIGKNDGNRATFDGEAVAHIKKLVARNEEAIKIAGATLAAEAKAKLESEIVVLRRYLPAQMSDHDLRTEIATIITESGQPKSPKLMGVIMSSLKAKYDGQYDNKKASEIARELLK